MEVTGDPSATPPSPSRGMPSERNIVIHVVKTTRGLGRGRAARRWRIRARCRRGRTRIAARVIRAGAAHALAAAQHLHLVSADFGAVFLDPVLVGPFARAQTALDIHLRTLAQVLLDDFGEPAVEDHAMPFGGFLHLAGLL